jgi:Uma2 family endonuclease
VNALLRQTDYVPHKLTVDDAVLLSEQGAFGDAKTELIDGVIYLMPADGELHQDWSAALFRWLGSLGPEYVVMPGTTLRLGPHDGPSPDWYVFPDALKTGEVRGPDVSLCVEQSDTSLRRDLKLKADLYSRFGVREYWVIDVKAQRLHRHREPSPEGYRELKPFGPEEVVEALLIPGLALRMADLPRVGWGAR